MHAMQTAKPEMESRMCLSYQTEQIIEIEYDRRETFFWGTVIG